MESTPGVGSTFSARIPLIYTAAEAAGDVVMTPEIDGARKTVLLVEDDLEVRLLYEKYLRGSGFQTVPARSIREAETLLQNIVPAAIVLDIVLPDVNAWEMLVELKARPSTRAIPIVVVTNLQERQKAMSLGADAFAVKPVERRWLLEQLTALTAGCRTGKVLVIDDEEVSRYLIRQLLPAGAVQVIEAANGAEGLRFAREEQPEVIILDLLMPGLDGFQVLDQLQSDVRTSRIPVIVSTSRLLDDADRRRLDRGGARLLPKSALSAGTAALELQRIWGELGLAGIWADRNMAPEERPSRGCAPCGRIPPLW